MTYVLPADTYDFLQAQAERYGGVGHSWFYRPLPKVDPEDDHEPIRYEACCIHGLTQPLEELPPESRSISKRQRGATGLYVQLDPHEAALRHVKLFPNISDTAFTKEEKKDLGFRLPFATWCERLKVVRES